MNKKLLLSTAVFAALSTPAFAADAPHQFYLEGQLGMSAIRDSNAKADFPSIPVSGGLPFDYGRNAVWSGAVGVSLLPSIRTEAELSHRAGDADFLDTTYPGLGTVTALKNAVKVKATTFMLNGWYDIDTGTAWTPYVGGGLGLAHLSAGANRASIVQADDSDAVFAYQVGAGTAYALNDSVSLTAGYRYLDTADGTFKVTETITPSAGSVKDDFSAHEWRLGVRYSF